MITAKRITEFIYFHLYISQVHLLAFLCLDGKLFFHESVFIFQYPVILTDFITH